MIRHSYKNASDNLAQYSADHSCSLPGRQEVTIDWFWEHGVDNDLCFFRWIGDEYAEDGLDAWRFYQEFPYGHEDAKAKGWRIFIQRHDLAKLKLPEYALYALPRNVHSCEPLGTDERAAT